MKLIVGIAASLVFANTAVAAPLDIRRAANRAERSWVAEWNTNPSNARASTWEGLPPCKKRTVKPGWRCTIRMHLDGSSGSCRAKVIVRRTPVPIAGKRYAESCVL